MTENGQGFTFVSLDHVNVTTPEELEEEVVTWYRECLGLEQLDKPGGTHNAGAWFRAGDHEVHIAIDEHNPPRVAHFGIVVDNYDAVIDQLRAAKCHIEQAREIPGRHRFFTRDPAGNRIEIISFDSGQQG
jgi:catechol 2,3-dioxygenase-like lactoylglutathione lyase family enzyme